MGKRAGNPKAQVNRRARKSKAQCLSEAELVYDFDDFIGEDSTSFSGSFAASGKQQGSVAILLTAFTSWRIIQQGHQILRA